MSDTPRREPPPGTKRHYSRPDPDMTDEEIDAWAEQFVELVPTDTAQSKREPR